MNNLPTLLEMLKTTHKTASSYASQRNLNIQALPILMDVTLRLLCFGCCLAGSVTIDYSDVSHLYYLDRAELSGICLHLVIQVRVLTVTIILVWRRLCHKVRLKSL